jgi:hypothetical protein
LEFENRSFPGTGWAYPLFTKPVQNMLVEIFAVGIGRQKVPVLMRWEFKVAIDCATLEL